MHVVEIFNPFRLERHLNKNEVRAIAIFDVVRGIMIKGIQPVIEVRAAIKRKQPFQAIHVLENFKACVSNLGGERCYELADEVIDLLEQEKHQSLIAKILGYLEIELNILINHAQKWLGQAEIRFNIALEKQRDQETEKQLEHFYIALTNSNFSACDQFHQLSGFLKSNLSNSEFTKLKQAIELLHFSKAAIYVKPLITDLL